MSQPMPKTKPVDGADLKAGMTLVGDLGGLSAVVDFQESSIMPGLVMVETEHGPLYLDPESEYLVLDED